MAEITEMGWERAGGRRKRCLGGGRREGVDSRMYCCGPTGISDVDRDYGAEGVTSSAPKMETAPSRPVHWPDQRASSESWGGTKSV